MPQGELSLRESQPCVYRLIDCLDRWRKVPPVSRIAILSDIHANLPALNSVLAEVDAAGVDEIFFGGDTVGYGASPGACIAKVRERGGRSVMGNHDFYTLEVRADPARLPEGVRETNPVWAGVAHAAESLDEEDIAWLASLPHTLPVGGGILAHAALHKPDQWPYLLSMRDAKPTLKILNESGSSIGFFGHTHRQDLFADKSAPAPPRKLDDSRIHIPQEAVCAIVVGSVGQPRGNDDLRAGWALWDSEERILDFRRTSYPSLDAATAILSAGLPAQSAIRLLDDAELAILRTIITNK